MIQRKFFPLLVPVLALAFVFFGQPAHAATFDPGRIIDDSVMTNSSSMSVQQIQAFLNSKVPNCDTNGTQPASDFGRPDLTHAQYAASRGWAPPPYPCLKDYNEGGRSAAQIIYDVSQQFKINPQTFIVLLQKESSLVTDSWPMPWQYRSATGYGCPDSTPGVCNGSYYGFTNQVTWAGRLFRSVINQSPTWYSPYIKGLNYIQWSPNAACGGSTVNIQNWSTAALYDYTPYRPNQAALNAGYGMGDGCSAYGNRNFFLYFNDWFGSTYTPSYSWQLTSQYAFTDSTKTTPIGLGNMRPGQRAFIGFTVVNTGNKTWTNSGPNPIRVGTSHPYDRNSSANDPTWLSPARPTTMKEASVAPGQTATFEFWITAPQVAQNTIMNEYYNLLAENLAWMPDQNMFFGINVVKPAYGWSLVGQAAYTDSTKTTPIGLSNLLPGQRVFVSMLAKNTGNTAWVNNGPNPTNLGTTHGIDRNSVFFDDTWLGQSRATRLKEASVTPGQVGTFEFWLKAPSLSQDTTYLEYFNPVTEGLAWFPDLGLNYNIRVQGNKYSWSLVSQYAFSDSTKTAPINLSNLSPGQTAYIGFVAKNTGNTTWTNSGKNPLRAGSSNPYDRVSSFCDASTWISCTRPSLMKEASVAPGQTGTFEFTIRAPITPGQYKEYYNLLSEARAWLDPLNMYFDITVR